MLRELKPKLYSVFLLFLSLFTLGCGGSNDEYVFTAGAPEVNEFVLRDEVRVLPADSGLAIEEITDDSITFSGNVPPINVGEVLIQNAGLQKFGRKVISVSIEGEKTVVQTGPISLTDVFAEADIQRSELVPAEVLRGLEPALPGVTIGQPFLAQGTGVTDNNFTVPVNFQNVLLGGKDSPNRILANGTIHITVGLETALKIDTFAQLRRFRLVPYFEASGKLDLQASGGGSFRQKIPITHTLSYPAGAIGPLPLEAGLKLVIDADGRVSGRGSLTIDGEVEASGGVDYSAGQWSLPTSFNYKFNIQPPEIKGEAELSVSAVGPELTLNLVGIGDAYVNSSLMRANLGLAYRLSPEPGFTFTKSTNFTVDAGVNLNLGPINIFTGALPRFSTPRVPLADPLFIPDPKVELPAASLTVSPGQLTLNLKDQAVLSAEAVFAGSPVGVPVPVEWTSSNPSAVSIVGNGNTATVTALQAGGSATVRATALGKSATATVTVAQPSLNQIAITPVGPRVMESSDLQLSVTATYSDGRKFDLTHISQFSTDNTGTLRVNSGGRLTGVRPGEATVTAKVGDQTTSARVVVFPRQYSRQAVQPPSKFDGELEVNESIELLAIAYYLDGSHRFNEREVAWASSNPNIISVDNRGRITGVGPGTATITGTLPGTGLSGSVTVRVAQPALRSLTIVPSRTNILVGDPFDLAVMANYADGTSVDVTRQVEIGVFWFGGIEFDPAVPGRVRVMQRGSFLFLAGFTHPDTPIGAQVVVVDGPAALRAVAPPVEVNTSVPFDLSIEALLGSGARSSKEVNISARLRTGGAVLSGVTTGTTAGGTITLSDLVINQPGEYELLIDSPGLQTAVIPISVVSAGGGTSDLLAHLFFGTVDGLSVGRLLDNEELELASGSPVELPGQSDVLHPHDVTTVGNFVYTTDSLRSLYGYRFSTETETLSLVQSALDLGNDANQALIASDETGLVFTSSGGVLKSFGVNATTGELTEVDSKYSSLSVRALLYLPTDSGGYTFEVDINGATVKVHSVDSLGNLSLTDEAFLGDATADRNYPSAIAAVGDYIYLARSVDSSPARSEVALLEFNRQTGVLTDQDNAWDTGASDPVHLVAYEHPVRGSMLYVAHDDGAITHFGVNPAGLLTRDTQKIVTPDFENPQRLLVRQTAEGDFLVATTANGVRVYKISEANGDLIEVTGSPFLDFGLVFGVAR